MDEEAKWSIIRVSEDGDKESFEDGLTFDEAFDWCDQLNNSYCDSRWSYEIVADND